MKMKTIKYLKSCITSLNVQSTRIMLLYRNDFNNKYLYLYLNYMFRISFKMFVNYILKCVRTMRITYVLIRSGYFVHQITTLNFSINQLLVFSVILLYLYIRVAQVKTYQNFINSMRRKENIYFTTMVISVGIR